MKLIYANEYFENNTTNYRRHKKMKNNEYLNGKLLQTNKKWFQLKQKQQIFIATLLRDLYIKFVLENNRKPNKYEKLFIVATVYLEIEDKEIWIPANEISRYFSSKIPKYDKSIEKFKSSP